MYYACIEAMRTKAKGTGGGGGVIIRVARPPFLDLVLSVCPFVTLVIHAYTVQDIEIWFTSHDALMLKDCSGTV